MKASLSWLKEFVDIKISPKELSHKLVMAGIHVDSFIEIDGDVVFEFEITSNRSDCLSIVGIAREISAITGESLKVPKEFISSGLDKTKISNVVVKVEDDRLCPKYTVAVIDNITIKDAPDWMQSKIKALSLRPVNNIVDITNYLLMETGQPMHAFDKDKIKGAIIIRCAKKGEKITTIDNIQRELTKDMLVIADDSGPIAIAGVMGGLSAEVTDTTKNIVLESAVFDPISVRRTARVLGLSSDSSYRFERKPDPDMVEKASLRAINMFKDIAGGTLSGTAIIGKFKRKQFLIDYSVQDANSLLGITIPDNEQERILKALNFIVTKTKNKWQVLSPETRKDISQHVDIVEEIIRIYGYDHIPETLPHVIGNLSLLPKDAQIRKQIKNILAMSGLNEIYTYSLVPSEYQDIFVPKDQREKLANVVNPLSREQEVMTHTLVVGMLRSMSHNINRKNTDLKFFEIGKRYTKEGKNKFNEEQMLCIGLTGLIKDGWITKARKVSFYDIKGVITQVLDSLAVKGVSFKRSDDTEHYTTAADIYIGNEKVGQIGKLDNDVLKKFMIKEDVYTAEIKIDPIIKNSANEIKYKPVFIYPSVNRDISVISDQNMFSDQIKETVLKTASNILKEISVVDLYKGKGIPQGKINLVYRLEYRDDTKTLTEDEVETVHSKVREALSAIDNIELK